MRDASIKRGGGALWVFVTVGLAVVLCGTLAPKLSYAEDAAPLEAEETEAVEGEAASQEEDDSETLTMADDGETSESDAVASEELDEEVVVEQDGEDDSQYEGEDSLVLEAMSITQEQYETKMNEFINDSRWSNGTYWPQIGPKLSSYGSTGCFAYACDFTKYVYGIDNYQEGTPFYSASEIRAGDVVRITGHTIVVLGRSGNTLYTAEGAYAYKVRITNSGYSVNGSDIAETGGSRHFEVGYHFDIKNVKPSNVVLKLSSTSFYADQSTTFTCSGDDVTYFEVTVYNASGKAVETKQIKPGGSYTGRYDAGTYTAKVKGVNKYGSTSGKDVSFTVKVRSLSSTTATLAATILPYSGQAVTPAVTVKLGSTKLAEGTDYTVAYKNNVNVGTATVTVTGKGNYTGSKSLTFKIVNSPWRRLAGEGRYITMEAIVNEGFSSSEWAIVAYGRSYPDALAAAPLAGSLDCPVILTNKDTITSQAVSELKRLGVKNVCIMGGEAVITANVESQIKELGIATTRVAGETRQSTSVEVLKSLAEGNPATVVVATGYDYADTLSIGPWCYANSAPLLLTSWEGKLTDEQLAAIKECPSIENVIVVGGTAAVSEDVEAQLEGYNVKRIAGATRYETSALIAAWEIEQGMSVDNVGVATGRNFPDALAGTALCGSRGSVLLLVADYNRTAIDSIVTPRAAQVSCGYVFGGTAAVSDATLSYCVQQTM